jgi:hypothetical protein
VFLVVGPCFFAGCALGDGGPDPANSDASGDRSARVDVVTDAPRDAAPRPVEDVLVPDFDADPEPPIEPEDVVIPALDATADAPAPADAAAMEASIPRDGSVLRDAATDGPAGRAVTRTMNYRMATYTLRQNWVHDCGRGYAFTARGSDHLMSDCDGLYMPDGTLRGTATFTFTSVVAANYDVIVATRFSANRDPAGALFRVNGESFNLDQRPGSTIVSTTLARRPLSGTVTVVLDSSRGGGSDSVQSVTLRPAP